MDVLAAIGLAAKVAALAIQVGQDALPFIALIQKWAKQDGQPTQADFNDLNAKEQVFLNVLNDTSKDVR